MKSPTSAKRWLLVALLAGCAHRQSTEEAAPKLPPAKPEAVEAFKDGARLVRLGPAHYDRAVERLEAATQLDPRMWEAYYDLGWLALDSRSYDRAVSALEKAVDLYPRHLPSVLALGRAYDETGRSDAAVKTYHAFLDGKWKTSSNDVVQVRVALASALRRLGKLDAALESLREALKAEPRSAPALAGMGLVYEAKGQHELAELVLHRSLDIDGKSRTAADVWNNLGLIALSRHHDQDAFADFAEAAKLDPTLLSARRNRAVVYLDCGDYEKAAADLRDIVKADDTDAAAWVALGVAERGRGQLDAAEKAYRHAIDVGGSSSEASDARYNLGVLYQDFRRNNDKARDAFADFLKNAPAKHGKVKDAESRMKDLAPRSDGAAQSKGGSSAPSPSGGGSKPQGGNGK